MDVHPLKMVLIGIDPYPYNCSMLKYRRRATNTARQLAVGRIHHYKPHIHVPDYQDTTEEPMSKTRRNTTAHPELRTDPPDALFPSVSHYLT